jgi:hypothetical protein
VIINGIFIFLYKNKILIMKKILSLSDLKLSIKNLDAK